MAATAHLSSAAPSAPPPPLPHPAGPAEAAPLPGAGITIAEALELPCLAGARLVAGGQGAERRVRVVNIMEVPDIVRWMRGGELLLTTAYALRGDEDALSALVPSLAARGLAGLGVKVGPYLPRLPRAMLQAADELGFPVLELPGEVMFNDILAEVIGTVLNRRALSLERSQEVHERLTTAVLRDGSYQELTTVLADLARCPAAVLGPDGTPLASAGDPPCDTEASTRRAIGAHARPSTSHGSVALWCAQPPTEDQLAALEHAATLAAMVAVQERAVAGRERRSRALLLTELVSAAPQDRAETARRAAAMGWELQVPRAAVLVELGEVRESQEAAERTPEERLLPFVRAVVGPRAIGWGVPSGLALLVEPGESLHAVVRAVYDAVATALPKTRVRVAAGGVQADFADLHLSYREAVTAMTLGRELHGTDFVCEHRDLGVYRLLDQLPRRELARLVDEALGTLLTYDSLHEGSLVHSLGVYLARDRNGVEAAEHLHIHYNTLRYRLKQIERLTGGFDRDPMSRLQTELAVHAHRLLTARARG
ncbi:PucR family transcriptional regulator ligand-binding domain-containing protein [Streptomyces sp. NPDC050738]|uniref:PucR family transcriptional regulator n=1 Tax=Streptomyces sp. NPDC050738 TaxID=3154744 RepID=UPI003448EC88